MGSGTNRSVMSSVVGKSGSESTLTKALENANEEQVKIDRPVSKKKESDE